MPKHGLLTHSSRNMDANVVMRFKISCRLGTGWGGKTGDR
ncbi:hypothetical protein BDE36_3818 [Arcticibacter tournemirensis]|nr:hypothetical protein BDE36_3818 [Arcticibacter tournemirensis]